MGSASWKAHVSISLLTQLMHSVLNVRCVLKFGFGLGKEQNEQVNVQGIGSDSKLPSHRDQPSIAQSHRQAAQFPH